MSLCAIMYKRQDEFLSSSAIKDESFLSLDIIRKILKLLVEDGIVESKQGPVGGYRLKRSPKDISVLDIINATDSPMAIVECIEEGKSCPHAEQCGLAWRWFIVNQRMKRVLHDISLEEMISLSPPVSGLPKMS